MEITLVVKIVVLISLLSQESRAGERYSNDDEGEFSSPGYPNNYGNNVEQSYYVKARRHDVILLTFLEFEVEDSQQGSKTDYISIREGRKSEDREKIYLFGNLSTPFVYISTTNRINIQMVTNNNITLKGFRVKYKFMKADAVCDASNLQTNISFVKSCNNITKSQSSQCVVQCRKNYRLSIISTNSETINNVSTKGEAVSTCVNGRYTKVDCQLISSVVSKCEETELMICPYTIDEILDYYENSRLELDPNLTEEQRQIEIIRLQRLESSAGRKRGNRCRKFCKRHGLHPNPFILPDICGKLPGKARKICLRCRTGPNACRGGGYLG